MSWITRLLDLDFWKTEALAEIDAAKMVALTEITEMDSAKISERMERVLMDSAYVIQIPDSEGAANAERLRAAIEGLGAHCVVVSADSMKVITFSSKT